MMCSGRYRLIGLVMAWLSVCFPSSTPADDSTLTALQSKAIQALADGDAGKAYEAAVELAAECASIDSPSKPTYMLTAAIVMYAVSMNSEGEKVLRLRQACLRENTRIPPDLELFAQLLAEIDPLKQKVPSFHSNMQYEILTNYLTVLLSKIDRTQTVEQQAAQFDELMIEHESNLIDAGVPVGVAKLLGIGSWSLAMESKRTGDAETLLMRLRPLGESADIAPKWKAFIWNKLTELSITQRRYAEALEHCHEFSQFAKLADDPEARVTCVEQYALIYMRMGDYGAARYLLQLTADYEKQNPNLSQANRWRSNLAKALEGDSEFQLSRQLLVEAHQNMAAEESFDSAMIINNLAINHYLTGDLPQAEELMSKSKNILERIGATGLQLAEAAINSGWMALASQHPQAARSKFQEAQKLLLEFPAGGRHHPRFAEALACEARAAALMGEPHVAAELLNEAESLAFSKLVKDLSATGSARDRLAILQEARVHPESVAWPGVFDTFLELADKTSIPAATQFEIVLKWKGVLNRFNQRQSLSPLQNDVNSLNSQLRDLHFRPVSRLKRKQLQQEIEQVETQLRVLERRMVIDLATVAASAKPPTLGEVAAQLDPTSVFVDVLQVRKYQAPQKQGAIGATGEYLAFVIESTGRVHRVKLGDTDAIDAVVERWRKQIIESDPRERETAVEVAQYLQRPLLPFMQSSTRFIVRPDGICHVVPWSALPGTEGKNFWIENLTFQLVNDVLPREHAPKNNTPKLLSVGGVEYGPLAKDWEPLPGTLTEAKHVAATFANGLPGGESKLLSKTDANEPAVLRELATANFVHLATHGFYLQQDVGNGFGLTNATTLLSSGLILAAPPAEVQASQRLTAGKIRELDLVSAELVVLSACETGLGKIKAGQGVDGLTSSFHAAGAQCVVSSLWKVPDAETTELMAKFYSELWLEKLPSAQALRQSQLHMLHESSLRKEARLPVSWAAFSASYSSLNCN